MKRGRKPHPTTKLKLVGTYRNDRHGRTPEAPAKAAECPSWLSENGRTYWPQIAETLLQMRLNSSYHTVSIALLCDALADFIRFSDIAATANPVETTDKGNAYQSPIFGLKNKAWARVLTALREFGMSPAALRGIEIPDGSPVDELNEVLA